MKRERINELREIKKKVQEMLRDTRNTILKDKKTFGEKYEVTCFSEGRASAFRNILHLIKLKINSYKKEV